GRPARLSHGRRRRSRGKVPGSRARVAPPRRRLGRLPARPLTEETMATGPALEAMTVTPTVGSAYPEPFKALVAGRERRPLGDAFGLPNFGVNLLRVPPGCASSQRHWHTRQDELVYVLSGELVLVTDAGEQLLTAGMVAGFPAGRADGHHLVNRSARDAMVI